MYLQSSHKNVVCKSYLQKYRSTNQKTFIYHHTSFGTGSPDKKRSEWPNKIENGIVCFHDLHPFDTQPVPCPVSYDKKNGAYGIYGVFCSFSCVAGWLRDHGFPDLSYQRSLLVQMAQDIFDFFEVITPAYPQSRLYMFGGDKTIEQFRAKKSSGFVRSYTRSFPFYHVPHVIEEHTSEFHENVGPEREEREESMVVEARDVVDSAKPKEPSKFELFIQSKKRKDNNNDNEPGNNNNNKQQATTTMISINDLQPPAKKRRGRKSAGGASKTSRTQEQ